MINIKDVDYEIKYCSLCKEIVIGCPKCKNTSCNAGGCDSCYFAFENSDEYIKAASIPGELCVKMCTDLHSEINKILEERHGLYKRLRHLEKR